ncbi:hypothetical protein NGUA18_02095 [Salmonella enterica]|nr:hypothetical protein NGUA18_02095 [Salmonella enterica]
MVTVKRRCLPIILPTTPAGPPNVGVVIFTTESPRHNVLNTDGSSRATFAATTYSDTSWTFYARMQKVLSNDVVVPGKLSSRVLVNVEYE